MSRTLILTGAAGWIGRAVATRARAAGWRVVAIDLGEPRDGPWDVFVPGNVAVDGFLGLAGHADVRGAEALVHAAGYAHRPVETPEEVERFFAINRDGSRRTVEVARRAGIGRVVYLSSIAFYDWTQGTDFDEDGPLARPTAYAASKLDGETAFRESGLDARVVRLGTVYGEGDRANFAKLAAALQRGRFLIPGDGRARKSVLPRDLAAELLVDLAGMDRPAHRLLNLALPEAPTLAEICDAYARTCGFPPARRVPLPLLRAGALAGDLLARLKPAFPLTSVNVRKLTTSTTVRTDRMQATFGGREWGTFESWLQPAAASYRSAGGTPR